MYTHLFEAGMCVELNQSQCTDCEKILFIALSFSEIVNSRLRFHSPHQYFCSVLIWNFTQHYEGHLKKFIVNECKKRFKISQYNIFAYSMGHADTIRDSVSTSLPVYNSFSKKRDGAELSVEA